MKRFLMLSVAANKLGHKQRSKDKRELNVLPLIANNHEWELN